jgi:hypothetical protein
MKQPKQYQQGDVMLVEVTSKRSTRSLKKLPREGGRVVLAHGEVTGHSHAIASPAATLFEGKGDERLLELGRAAVLSHEEHGDIKLPQGLFKVVRQREFQQGQQTLVAD